MKQLQKRKAKGRVAKSILRLPDLEIAKSAVLSSLSCPDAQRGYRHVIDEFVDWYCSEPRLSFSKTVVVRYRIPGIPRHLAPTGLSISGWGRFAVWRTRRRIVGFLAPTWRPESGASRA